MTTKEIFTILFWIAGAIVFIIQIAPIFKKGNYFDNIKIKSMWVSIAVMWCMWLISKIV